MGLKGYIRWFWGKVVVVGFVVLFWVECFGLVVIVFGFRFFRLGSGVESVFVYLGCCFS